MLVPCGPELDIVPCQGGSFRAPETGVSHDSDDREVDGASGLRHGSCLGATIAAASRKAGSLPDAGQGVGGECVGLFGRWSLIAPAFEDLGHGWMAGGVIALRYALGGMGEKGAADVLCFHGLGDLPKS